MTVRVIKVGGSLLDWPLLGARLWNWLQEQPPANNYLLAGGGAFADAVRQADALHQLGEDCCHRACIDLMRITGTLVERIVQQAKAAPGAASDQQRRVTWVDVPALLGDESFTQRVTPPLPCSWDVTSDSIAAYLSESLRAHELVLLKSQSLPCSMSFAAASAAKYVDRYFPLAAARLAKVRAVNLRAEYQDEWILFAGR